MIKLYYNPGSCSLASHIALEESGATYRAVLIDTKASANREAEYLAVNPWGRVPALEVDGLVLTESVAILQHIADRWPERKLLPLAGTWARAKAVEQLSLLSSSVHVAFRGIFRPGRLASTEAGIADVNATGLRSLTDVLTALDGQLAQRAFVLGDDYSLCDAYLLVFTLWSRRPALRDKLPALPNLTALARRASERPAVAAAIEAEGLELLSDR